MPSVTYLYSPNTSVYIIDSCGVHPGVIVKWNYSIDTIPNVVNQYDVKVLPTNNIIKLAESSIFPDKTSALAAYTLLVP